MGETERAPEPAGRPDPQAILDATADAIYTRALDGTVLTWNAAAERIYGFAPAEVVGRPVVPFVPPERVAELHGAIARVADGEPHATIETERIRKDGRRIAVELTLTPIADADGGIRTVCTTARDITDRAERRRAEAELGRTAELLRAVVDASPVGIFVCDRELRITYANPAMATMLGYTPAELAERRLDVLPPEERADTLGRLRRAVAGEDISSVPGTRIAKGGRRVPVESHYAPVRDEDGEIAGMVGLVVDVSQRRRLEEQLLESHKMEGIGRLAGGVAHDFNNILTAIIGHADLLLMDVGEASELREGAEAIRSAAEKGSRLTRQLLAVSRRASLQPERLDLNAVVGSMRPILRPLLGEHISFVVETDERVGQVLADASQLEQVILNLVVNARDAMPDGGEVVLATRVVDIEAAREEAGVVIPPGRYASLSVRDSGIGMDDAVRGRIFEPFFTTKAKGKGTGLGLATTYGIVRQSGGHIRLETATGRGSTFEVLLPLHAEPGARPEPPAEASRDGPPASGLVLLAEDEPAVRDIQRRILERMGFEVLVARDGDEALRIAREHAGSLTLLVTDVVMPGRSGPQLARVLATEQPALPILFLSGYADEILDGIEGLDERSFLAKPFTSEAFTERVRELVGRGSPIA